MTNSNHHNNTTSMIKLPLGFHDGVCHILHGHLGPHMNRQSCFHQLVHTFMMIASTFEYNYYFVSDPPPPPPFIFHQLTCLSLQLYRKKCYNWDTFWYARNGFLLKTYCKIQIAILKEIQASTQGSLKQEFYICQLENVLKLLLILLQSSYNS